MPWSLEILRIFKTVGKDKIPSEQLVFSLARNSANNLFVLRYSHCY